MCEGEIAGAASSMRDVSVDALLARDWRVSADNGELLSPLLRGIQHVANLVRLRFVPATLLRCDAVSTSAAAVG